MPLNHDLGEPIDGLGPFRVVSNAKWRETAMFDQAATIAAQAFMEKGALLPITFDEKECLCQEFPGSNVLMFIFCKSIRGTEHYSIREFQIPDDMMKELKALGKWAAMPPYN